MTEEEARQVLQTDGTRRRKRQRLLRVIRLGSSIGILLGYGLALAHMIRFQELFAWIGLNGLLNTFGWRLVRESSRQKAALQTLTPQAQLEDIAWLIEGLEYSEMRLQIVERLQELLPRVTAQDAPLLPEGARKILRSHISQLDAALPFRIVALEALLRIGDEKTSKLVQKLAKKKPQVPGEEALIAMARRALEQETADLTAPSLSASEAHQMLQEFTVVAAEKGRQLQVTRLALLVLILAGLGFFLVTHNPFLFFGALVLATVLALADALRSSMKVPDLNYQCACLRLVETAEKSELPLLIDHIGQLQSHTHQELAYQSLTRLLNQLTPGDQHLLTPKVRKWLQGNISQTAGLDVPDWYRAFEAATRRVLESHGR
ncbi:hypothetical protein [Armatimonas sp.]|uniref:hypothetical protein n=1 Tax=Armatimonas sp. TaxID=1872638 RepID=UPI00286BF557|nr:hypothetical protein [Armatimonas sp.]